MDEPSVLHLRIRGRVQGVGYRMSMAARARQLGVNGWVRNCSDGSVEAMIQGPRNLLDDLIAWARQGPPHSRVEVVDTEPGAGEFSRFDTWPDA